MPDSGGQGQDALGDAGADPGDGAAVVVLEVELTFEGVVDRFDDLAQWFEEPFTGSGLLAFAGGAQQVEAGGVEAGFERLAVVVLVADHHRPWLGSRHESGCGGEDLDEHVAFVGFGAGQCPADRESVQGAHQMQAQAPEVTTVRGAVTVLGPAGLSERFTVSRERPHSTGVESTTHTSSVAMLVCAPSALTSQAMVSASLRSRLL